MPTHAATAGKKMKTGVDNYCDSTCRLENYRFRSQEKDSFPKPVYKGRHEKDHSF